MSVTTRLVVVGADAAGMSAAHQALRGAKARGRALEVIALEKTQHTSYSACGIPYWIAGDVDDAERLVARTVDEHRAVGIDLRMRATATRVDPGRREVTYRDASGADTVLPFDELVLATGAAPIIPDWARGPGGALVAGVHPLKDLDDGATWLDLLGLGPRAGAGTRPGRGVIVGGGYLGVEMAEALHRRGWDTVVLTRSSVLSSLDPDMSVRIEAAMLAAGVNVVQNAAVTGLERGADGRVAAVVTADGTSHPADVVVLALGVRPATRLGVDAALPVGRSGGYLTDAGGRLGDGIWAAGDCCEVRHRISGASVFLPLGTHANKAGRVVGENLSGGSAAFGGALGTAITQFVTGDHHVEIARTGLSSAQAAAAGIEASSLVTEARTAAGYMPQANPIATKVIACTQTRRLLGLQIVGAHGAGKRIDTGAAALWGGLSVDDLAGMDLAYAPPFATVWEAVQLAARRLADRM